MKVSINQQVEEIERELGMRRKVYPNMIARGKLRQSEADYFMARLEAARLSLCWLRDNREACVAFIAQQGKSDGQ